MTSPPAHGQSATATASLPAHKPCRACKLAMPLDANKCTNCDSLQNWRRYLDSSGIVLSLLVALTSVLTFAIPIWKETLTDKVAKPTSTLIEVDDIGLATLVVTNGGNAPAVLEDALLGTDEAVVNLDLGSIPPQQRIILPNALAVFPLRLSVANTVDDVWNLVRIFRASKGCELHVVVISPDGQRTITAADTSTAGHDEPEATTACSLKLRKLTTMTLDHLGQSEEYADTFCKVAELHPRDPKNPQVGTACRKNESPAPGQ
jgi:hypothetical protein